MRTVFLSVIGLFIGLFVGNVIKWSMNSEKTEVREVPKSPPPAPKLPSIPKNWGDFKGCGWNSHGHGAKSSLVCAFEDSIGTIRFHQFEVGGYGEGYKVNKFKIERN